MAKPYTFDPTRKHSLGHRAFFVFLFQHSRALLIFAAIGIGTLIAERWIPQAYALWGDFAAQIIAMVGWLVVFMIFLRTYLEYRYYTYLFTDDAFIMTYGYLVRNEIATLYHQIQNVNIQRSIADRMIGVSQIIILMTGSDRGAVGGPNAGGAGGRNQIVLPAVSQRKAKLVQAELLRRARRHAGEAVEEA